MWLFKDGKEDKSNKLHCFWLSNNKVARIKYLMPNDGTKFSAPLIILPLSNFLTHLHTSKLTAYV